MQLQNHYREIEVIKILREYFRSIISMKEIVIFMFASN